MGGKVLEEARRGAGGGAGGVMVGDWGVVLGGSLRCRRGLGQRVNRGRWGGH